MIDRKKELHLLWLNIFIRDVLLCFVLIVVNKLTNFSSWWVGVITGMFIVLVTWHLDNYFKVNFGGKLK